MIPESKIIDFLLIIGVLIFILMNYSRIKEIPYYKILITSFLFLLFNITLAILEEIIWGNVLNLVQHSCITISSILLTIWCFKIFTNRRKNNGCSNDS